MKNIIMTFWRRILRLEKLNIHYINATFPHELKNFWNFMTKFNNTINDNDLHLILTKIYYLQTNNFIWLFKVIKCFASFMSREKDKFDINHDRISNIYKLYSFLRFTKQSWKIVYFMDLSWYKSFFSFINYYYMK